MAEVTEKREASINYDALSAMASEFGTEVQTMPEQKTETATEVKDEKDPNEITQTGETTETTDNKETKPEGEKNRQLYLGQITLKTEGGNRLTAKKLETSRFRINISQS